MIKIKNDVEYNVNPMDLFRSANLKNQEIELDINIPDSFYQTLLEQFFERDYLNDTEDKIFFKEKEKKIPDIHWVQIDRLPIHPNQNESYDLISRWQGALSSLHAWNYRLIFLLLRYNESTRIFMGTISDRQSVTAEVALEQIREATFGSMPGIGLKSLSKKEALSDIILPLHSMNEVGGVTGIPSFRNNDGNSLIQTLDQLAFGIRDSNGVDKDFAMLVISDPIGDKEISEIIAQYRTLGSQIHTAVSTMGSQSSSMTESKGAHGAIRGGLGILGSALGALAGTKLGNPIIGANLGNSLACAVGSIFGLDTSKTGQGGASVSTEFLDKFAEYAETMTEKHIQRLTEGRNLGFWNTGVYVLGNQPKDVVTVTGMLRSVYSGDETYIEPIRLHLFENNSNAKEIVRDRFDLLPLVDVNIDSNKFDLEKGQWHILGKRYQYVSTPINTKELSLATSLPRHDVPGLRFVKTAVRFANNPAVINGDNKITIGNLVDMGITHGTTYDINPNSLVRHALVTGSTGSGKSTTCKRILNETLKRDVPIMVIEPAKDDYVRWAIEKNKELPKGKQFKIYMPGVKEFDGMKIEELKINGYEPACAKGAGVDLLQHSEIYSTLLNSCLPSEEVVPILIEEVVNKTIYDTALLEERDFENGEVAPLNSYPTIDHMISVANKVMDNKGYEEKVKLNMKEVLLTRFMTLKRGMRGKILNVSKSTDYDQLFSSNVIINISHLAGSKDKALIMSLLMNALYEYRISKYTNDAEYRHEAQENKLLHLCLIEEAHNVLLKPHESQRNGSPQSAVADLFGNMLSEVRGYGQGFVVVDQVPTRLIDDVIKNTNYKIVHRLTAPDDQSVMASCMAFREDQKYIIPALEKGHAIICGDEDDAAVWVKIPLS